MIELDLSDLFFIPHENRVFQVLGYCDQFDIIRQRTEQFAQHCGVDLDKISIRWIEKSRRYKRMFAIYASTDKCPDQAFVIDNDSWSMIKWLED